MNVTITASDVVKIILPMGLGVFFTLLWNYVGLSKDISFIKGQLTELATIHQRHQKLTERVAANEKERAKDRLDLNRYYEKMRALESRVKEFLLGQKGKGA